LLQEIDDLTIGQIGHIDFTQTIGPAFAIFPRPENPLSILAVICKR
jgi:hypothetical protein